MKRMLTAAFLLLSSLCSVSAQAAVSPLTVGVGLGEVNSLSSGSTTYDGIDGRIWAEYYGSLPGMTKITFTYDIIPSSDASVPLAGYMGLSSIGSSIIDTSINATVFTDVNPTAASATDNLVTAYASLPSFTNGTASITNLSAELVSFKTTLIAFLNQYVGLKVTWNVSSVPLPAALPLFGLGLASLAGYRLRKKKTDGAVA
ncbi:MAG: VPLPA-CTERM sorting domain-containing protein [Alphaproteobacteria bacterium]|nr:VPLPA-CTERM sorting domain-containing protein [Alphaproteobacteria bacterium]